MLENKTVGNYRIIDHIGSGGMGNVYIGEDIHLKRKVAIKVVKQELVNRPNIIERFKLEAVTLARLNHPNVATIYAFMEENNNCYIVTELISGWSLSSFIEKIGALPLSVALYFFKQILAGMGSIHAENIVHRDLKASNIMINEKFTVKIMDFGIARFESGGRFTRYDRLVGTIEYMSPEQILGKEVTTVSDIYSLGVLLFQMVTGCLPFSGDREYELMKSQVENPPPSPLKFKPDLPDKLGNILSLALAKNPQARFQSAGAFIGALDQIDTEHHDVDSELKEMIQFYQLENKKTIDEMLPLRVDDKGQDRMSPSKSYGNKKQTSTYLRINYEKLILLLGQRPWVGPLILFFSILIVGGLILKDNLSFNHHNPFQEPRIKEEFFHKVPLKNPYQEKIDNDDLNMATPTESNGDPLEIHDHVNPVGTKPKAPNNGLINDKVSQIPKANHSPLNSGKRPPDKTSAQSFPPPKNTSEGHNYVFTNDGADLKGGSEAERIRIIKQSKTKPKSTADPDKENNEWIIRK